MSGIRCLDCGDAIWSKHRHDMVWCSCKKVAIDGGRAYMRVTFSDRPPDYVDVLIDENDNKVGYIKCKVKNRSSS